MDLLNLGSQSRKTGIRPRQNIRKDKYDMEDIDEFFSDEDDHTMARPSTTATTNKKPLQSSLTPKDSFNHVAKRLNFDSQPESFNLSPISITSKFATSAVKSKNKKSPLRSPLPEHKNQPQSHKREKQRLFVDEGTDDFNSQNDDDYDVYGDNNNDADYDDGGPPPPAMSLSPVDISPIKKKIGTDKKASRAASSFTKRMALGKPSKSKRKSSVIPPVDDDDDDDDEAVEKSQHQVIVDDDDDGASELISPPPTNKRKPKRSRSSIPIQPRIPQQPTIIKPSPLPSPPPDGLRRSKRVKVAPIAYWRNEKIVYSRADETEADPDTTLATDIRNVPLQIIKEIVQMPELPNGIKSQAKRSRSRSRTTPPKSSSTNNRKKNNKPVYDYESDPEITGSEWFTKKSLEVNVFEDDEAVKRTIAYSPEGGEFRASSEVESSEKFDKYALAQLFGDTKATSACGLLDFPLEGSKSFRSSGQSIYYFHVVKGLCEISLNDSTFVVTRGSSFVVPPQNSYGFKNIGQDSARLFFVQSRVGEIELEGEDQMNDNGVDDDDDDDDESW